MAALIWLILGLVLVVAELVSGDFVLVMLGAAALATSLATALGAPVIADVAIFAVLSVGLVFGARPALKRKFHVATLTHTNVAALVGRRAVALTEVNEHSGQVKIDGEVWSARTFDDMVIERGAAVTVVEISGATAIVLAKP